MIWSSWSKQNHLQNKHINVSFCSEENTKISHKRKQFSMEKVEFYIVQNGNNRLLLSIEIIVYLLRYIPF
jgi:hypothetical protein